MKYARRVGLLLIAAGLLPNSDYQRAEGAAVEKMEVELVTLRDGGFYPIEIARPHGRFLLVVKNRSNSDSVDLALTREDGAVVAAKVHVIAINRDYVLDLPAHKYTLTDESHPDWTPLTIVVK